MSSWNHAKEYIAYIAQCTKGLWNNNFMQKFENKIAYLGAVKFKIKD